LKPDTAKNGPTDGKSDNGKADANVSNNDTSKQSKADDSGNTETAEDDSKSKNPCPGTYPVCHDKLNRVNDKPKEKMESLEEDSDAEARAVAKDQGANPEAEKAAAAKQMEEEAAKAQKLKEIQAKDPSKLTEEEKQLLASSLELEKMQKESLEKSPSQSVLNETDPKLPLEGGTSVEQMRIADNNAKMLGTGKTLD